MSTGVTKKALQTNARMLKIKLLKTKLLKTMLLKSFLLKSKSPLQFPHTLIIMLGLLLSTQSCSSTLLVQANSNPAIQSDEVLTPELILDIGIVPPAPGIPDTEEELELSVIEPEVRRAESLFIAYHLKDTLEKTGNWGAVRVTPDTSSLVDIIITGEIILSDGESLEAKIKAYDSTGRVWINKTYSDNASKFSYNLPQEDPFQDLYNKIANDLLAYRQSLKTHQITRIQKVSAVLYAKDLSPYAYGDYVRKTSSGKVEVKQLPADNDPMMVRINRIKERDYLFVDTLDDFYGKFYREMQAPYHEWRRYTYDEARRLRLIQKQARNKILTGAALIAGGLYAGSQSRTYAEHVGSVGAVSGGIGVLKSGLSRKKDAEIHAASLKEISASLASEIKPVVLEVEGHTVELKGSVEGQYQNWRKILRKIYAEETGLPVD